MRPYAIKRFYRRYLYSMKVVAFLLVFCMFFLFSIPGRANIIQTSTKENCCHKASKNIPCGSNQKDDCSKGVCNTMLSCSTCGFLKIEPVRIKAIITILNDCPVTPYLIGNGSNFSLSYWNPPKL